MNSVPPEIEQRILDAYGRWLAQFRAGWTPLDNLLAALAARPMPSDGESLEESARDWLLAPLNALRSARPLERALEAIEAHGRWRVEFAAAADTSPGEQEHARPAQLLREHELWAGPRYGQLIGLMAQAALELLTPWQLVRRAAHRSAAGMNGGPDFRRSHAEWIARMATMRLRVNALLERMAARRP